MRPQVQYTLFVSKRRRVEEGVVSTWVLQVHFIRAGSGRRSWMGWIGLEKEEGSEWFLVLKLKREENTRLVGLGAGGSKGRSWGLM